VTCINSLIYLVTVIERADESQGYNYWIVGGVTLAVIAASMYWFIARPLTRKNQKGPELSSPGTVKWLVAENELIPFTELDKRKSCVQLLNQLRYSSFGR